jgi:hypothetical protein
VGNDARNTPRLRQTSRPRQGSIMSQPLDDEQVQARIQELEQTVERYIG